MTRPPRLPALSTVALVAFIGLNVTALIAGAVRYPGGGAGLAFWIAPGGLAMAAFGGFTITNYRGTVDVIGDWQQAARRLLSRRLGPPPRAAFACAAGGFFLLVGLFIAVGGPILA